MAEADQIREAADDILSKPEYAEPTPSLLDRVVSWMTEQLGEALAAIFGGGGNYVIGLIVLTLAITGIGFLLWRVMPRRRLTRSAPVLHVETSSTPRAGRSEWLAQAAAAEAEGNWPEAVRARYRALVAGLVDRAEVDDQPGATSGEYQRSFHGGPVRAPLFDRATERFEAVWYGGDDADVDDSATLRELDSAVLDGGRS